MHFSLDYQKITLKYSIEKRFIVHRSWHNKDYQKQKKQYKRNMIKQWTTYGFKCILYTMAGITSSSLLHQTFCFYFGIV